jgi:protein-L-isoaspartate(D-aspartate) O-methyltransferase
VVDEARALARRLRPAVDDERVLAAIAAVPRERFVGPDNVTRAYENVALPIGGGQTISQPVVVARMLELLELDGQERVLDVGTGSGYHAALLSLLCAEVVSIERLTDLSASASTTLGELGYDNVTCLVADGWHGALEHGPFDAINVAAAFDRLPSDLIDQLRPGGHLVAPVGDEQQRLTRYTRTPEGAVEQETLEAVRFVPLVREQKR